jgi:putative holliday junction resolvase
MKYLGIDYGTKRIGIATSDDEGRVAFPLTVVDAGPEALSQIVELAKKNNVQKVVIGESQTLGGEANAVQEDIGQFKKDIAELSGLPVEYEREFFTSSLAARQFTPDGSRKENPEHKNLDASAAALLLQSYLDKMNTNGAH